MSLLSWKIHLYVSTQTHTQNPFIQPHIYIITVFSYIKFQANGPKRPPLRQNNVTGLGVTWVWYLYVHVYILFYIGMFIHILFNCPTHIKNYG